MILTLLNGCSRDLGSAGGTKIIELVQNEAKYQNESVWIKGRVVNAISVPFVGHALYDLEDATGKIRVYSKVGSPQVGKTVRVRGRLKSPQEMNDISTAIENILGPTFVEEIRK